MTSPAENFPVHTAFWATWFILLAIAFGVTGQKPAAYFAIGVGVLGIAAYMVAMVLNTFFR